MHHPSSGCDTHVPFVAGIRKRDGLRRDVGFHDRRHEDLVTQHVGVRRDVVVLQNGKILWLGLHRGDGGRAREVGMGTRVHEVRCQLNVCHHKPAIPALQVPHPQNHKRNVSKRTTHKK